MSRILHAQNVLPVTLVALAAVLVSALTFVGWMRYGSAIFLSLIENGLAYCF